MAIKKEIIWFIVAAVLLSAFLHFSSPKIPDLDSFYHIRHASLLKNNILDTEYPWLSYSAIREKSADLWYGFHLLITPFTFGDDLLFGIKLAGVFLTSILFITPFIFYLAHSFMNILPTLAFFIPAIYYSIKYFNNKSLRYAIISISFFSVSSLFRYEYAIFSFIVFLLFLFIFKNLSIIKRDLIFIILSNILFFLLPFILINYQIYGNYFFSGPSLFIKTYFPERLIVTSNLSFLKNILYYLMPSENFNWTFLLFNIYKYFIYYLGILSVLAFLGIITAYNSKVSKKILISSILLFIYIIIYRGTSNVWGVWNNLKPDLNHALLRYWMVSLLIILIYLNIFLNKRKNMKKTIIFLMFSLICLSQISYLTESKSQFGFIYSYKEGYLEVIELVNSTPNNSIIFSSFSDKYISPYRQTATWWNGPEKYNSTQIAESIIILNNNNYSNIYVYRENEVNIEEININLVNESLYLSSINNTRLYKVDLVNSLKLGN